MQSNWGQTPTCYITSIILALCSTPSSNANPPVGVLIPVKTFIKVDFPAPFGPIIPNISPFFTENVSY
jgi:hypothetical protein